MAIIEHGAWERYTPDPPKADMPPNIMYARRIGDNVDWYEYIQSKPFQDGSVIMTVHRRDDSDLIQAATRDPSMIFPQSMTVIEETEYIGTVDPQTEFNWRLYNADSRTVGDKYVPASKPVT